MAKTYCELCWAEVEEFNIRYCNGCGLDEVYEDCYMFHECEDFDEVREID